MHLRPHEPGSFSVRGRDLVVPVVVRRAFKRVAFGAVRRRGRARGEDGGRKLPANSAKREDGGDGANSDESFPDGCEKEEKKREVSAAS